MLLAFMLVSDYGFRNRP